MVNENRIFFMKDVKLTDGKADTICAAMKFKKMWCGVGKFQRVGSDGASVMIGHKKVASKLNSKKYPSTVAMTDLIQTKYMPSFF